MTWKMILTSESIQFTIVNIEAPGTIFLLHQKYWRGKMIVTHNNKARFEKLMFDLILVVRGIFIQPRIVRNGIKHRVWHGHKLELMEVF
jgi:hypothetical protein